MFTVFAIVLTFATAAAKKFEICKDWESGAIISGISLVAALFGMVALMVATKDIDPKTPWVTYIHWAMCFIAGFNVPTLAFCLFHKFMD
jgi:hypothetical protein